MFEPFMMLRLSPGFQATRITPTGGVVTNWKKDGIRMNEEWFMVTAAIVVLLDKSGSRTVDIDQSQNR
jgi:hypothetical protein